MATIVGIEANGGAVLAGDRLVIEGGTVKSKGKRHVFDFGPLGAATTGGASGVDEFRRRLESEVQSYETEHGEPMGLDRFASVVGDVASDVSVEAIVTARDDEGVARVRTIGRDGSILVDERSASGSGAQFVLGILEESDPEIGVEDAESLAREAIETTAERDTATGTELDTYRLDDRN